MEDSAGTHATEASRANSAVTTHACLSCDEQAIQVYGEHEPMPRLPPQEMKRIANRPLCQLGVKRALCEHYTGRVPGHGARNEDNGFLYSQRLFCRQAHRCPLTGTLPCKQEWLPPLPGVTGTLL